MKTITSLCLIVIMGLSGSVFALEKIPTKDMDIVPVFVRTYGVGFKAKSVGFKINKYTTVTSFFNLFDVEEMSMTSGKDEVIQIQETPGVVAKLFTSTKPIKTTISCSPNFKNGDTLVIVAPTEQVRATAYYGPQNIKLNMKCRADLSGAAVVTEKGKYVGMYEPFIDGDGECTVYTCAGL